MSDERRRWTSEVPPTEDGSAFELDRTKDTVTLGWTRNGKLYKTVAKTVTYSPNPWEPAFRETRRIDSEGRKIWVSCQLDPDKEREARQYLERRYEHVLTLHDHDALIEEGRRICERDYWDDVRGCAESLVERIKEKTYIKTSEDLREAIHNDVDGSARVIYTHLAIECLRFSKYDGRAVEEGLVDASQFKDGIPWSALAYAAFEQDVYDQLDALGIDVNSDTFGLEEDEDEDDDEDEEPVDG